MKNDMKKPLIFVTNDDGFDAKGFKALLAVARKFGRVVGIAPERTQSGQSHAITMFSPLYLRQVRAEKDFEVYACSGTPVDCVKMAFDHLLKDEFPTLTVSGINHGSNSAISVLYSGTMGAAIEASFYGRPAIGFSLNDHDADADFEAAMLYAESIIGKVLALPAGQQLCFNVNIPAVPYEQIKGVRMCRQNDGYWKETFVCRKDPRGKDYYWLTGDFFNTEPDAEGTDEWALRNNYVSIVPVQTDMTNHRQIDNLGSTFNE